MKEFVRTIVDTIQYDWNESHRSTYVLSVYMTAILSLGTAVLDEFFNRR